MEFFTKAKAVRIRSHLDKYLYADEDKERVRQSRQGSSRNVKWEVELVEGNKHVVRLKSCYGRYLTATDVNYLTGMTGKKVNQTVPTKNLDSSLINWKPIRDGFQVKLKTFDGNFLRANGGTPPWRNTITHGTSKVTQDWIFWDVEAVDITDDYEDGSLEEGSDHPRSPSSSTVSEDLNIDSPKSPWSSIGSSVKSYSWKMSSLSSKVLNLRKVKSIVDDPAVIDSPSKLNQLGMDHFRNAKAIRLKSHHEKYLHAEEDEESVSQDRNGSSKTAKWNVEFIHGGEFIRLKSCFGKYLTASNAPFLLGMTGRKVLQTLPKRLDSSIEWEPIRDGVQIKLKTRYGNYLRANGGLPPWRNSVTHDVPHRTSTQDWILWDVDVLDIQQIKPAPTPAPAHVVVKPKEEDEDEEDEEEEEEEAVSPSVHPLPLSEPSSPVKTPKFTKQESSDSFVSSSFKVDGRKIFYYIADENGNYDDGIEGSCFVFKGNGVSELTQKLKEETGIEDIIVCTRNLLTGMLCPLRLHLPPNNATMNVVVVEAFSRVARSFANPGL